MFSSAWSTPREVTWLKFKDVIRQHNFCRVDKSWSVSFCYVNAHFYDVHALLVSHIWLLSSWRVINSHFIHSEYPTVFQLITTFFIFPLSSFMVNNFGTSSFFTLSPTFFLSAIVLIQIIFFTRPKKKEEGFNEDDHSVTQNFIELCNLFKTNKMIVLPIL